MFTSQKDQQKKKRNLLGRFGLSPCEDAVADQSTTTTAPNETNNNGRNETGHSMDPTKRHKPENPKAVGNQSTNNIGPNNNGPNATDQLPNPTVPKETDQRKAVHHLDQCGYSVADEKSIVTLPLNEKVAVKHVLMEEGFFCLREVASDGNCLFHSLCVPNTSGKTAQGLKNELLQLLDDLVEKRRDVDEITKKDTDILADKLVERFGITEETDIITEARNDLKGGKYPGDTHIVLCSYLLRTAVTVYTEPIAPEDGDMAVFVRQLDTAEFLNDTEGASCTARMGARTLRLYNYQYPPFNGAGATGHYGFLEPQSNLDGNTRVYIGANCFVNGVDLTQNPAAPKEPEPDRSKALRHLNQCGYSVTDPDCIVSLPPNNKKAVTHVLMEEGLFSLREVTGEDDNGLFHSLCVPNGQTAKDLRDELDRLLDNLAQKRQDVDEITKKHSDILADKLVDRYGFTPEILRTSGTSLHAQRKTVASNIVLQARNDLKKMSKCPRETLVVFCSYLLRTPVTVYTEPNTTMDANAAVFVRHLDTKEFLDGTVNASDSACAGAAAIRLWWYNGKLPPFNGAGTADRFGLLEPLEPKPNLDGNTRVYVGANCFVNMVHLTRNQEA